MSSCTSHSLNFIPVMSSCTSHRLNFIPVMSSSTSHRLNSIPVMSSCTSHGAELHSCSALARSAHTSGPKTGCCRHPTDGQLGIRRWPPLRLLHLPVRTARPLNKGVQVCRTGYNTLQNRLQHTAEQATEQATTHCRTGYNTLLPRNNFAVKASRQKYLTVRK